MKTRVIVIEVQWHGDRPFSYHFHRTGYRPNSYGHTNRTVRYSARDRDGEFNMHRYRRLEAAMVNNTYTAGIDAVMIFQSRREIDDE